MTARVYSKGQGPSRLATASVCERLWLYKVGRGDREEVEDFRMDVGTAVHDLYAQHYRGVPPILSSKHRPDVAGQAAKVFEAVAKACSPGEGKVLHTEDAIEVELACAPGVWVGGTPDLVLEMPDGRIVVDDLKTSGQFFAKWIAGHVMDFQFVTYLYLLRRMYPGREVSMRITHVCTVPPYRVTRQTWHCPPDLWARYEELALVAVEKDQALSRRAAFGITDPKSYLPDGILHGECWHCRYAKECAETK